MNTNIIMAHFAELDELDDAILRDNDNGIDGSGEVLWSTTVELYFH